MEIWTSRLKMDPLRKTWHLIPGSISKERQGERKNTFGHWSSLGLVIRKKFVSLDTGCGRGELLTAIRLGDNRVFSTQVIDDMLPTSCV